MTKFQKLRWLGFIVLVIAAFISIFFYFQNERQRKATEDNEKRARRAQFLEESEPEYKRALDQLCSKPLTEASALELYLCKDLKSSEGLIELGISPESATKSAHLPAYCNRKIIEMKMLELLECLNSADIITEPNTRIEPEP